jgi:hypothetical protein
MATTFCVSGAAIFKAGKGINANLSGGTLKVSGDVLADHFINQAESLINVHTRYNWTDNYSGLNADTKKILEEVASDLAAIYLINFDMSGYTSRVEAEDMINVLRDASLRGLSILKDKKSQDFINGS